MPVCAMESGRTVSRNPRGARRAVVQFAERGLARSRAPPRAGAEGVSSRV